MGILTWVVIGLVVGLLASKFSNSRGNRKLVMLFVGLIGALLGWLNVAFLFQVPKAYYDVNWMVIVASLIGAGLTVALFGLLKPQKVTVQ